MSIEHGTIPVGKIHVVANWNVASVAARDVLVVVETDIGKVAWVRGVGHFVLASAVPRIWEAITIVAPTFATFAAFTAARPLANNCMVCITVDETNADALTFYAFFAATNKAHWIPTVEV